MRQALVIGFVIAGALASLVAAGVDYYELLGVARDADDRTIRRAFKKIAIIKHPDKNPDDESAHAEFVKINRAYEVLKDEELRKKYDQFGEEGLSDDFQGGNKYESWKFYNTMFGIYDDDQEIVTLSRSDFQQTVIDSGEVWFVNFYSTYCSHCHDLAPTWREFARDMEGVVRIGAVNCAEDPALCQSQRVMGYPSLVLFPDHVFYQGPRELKPLQAFIMSRLTAEVHKVTFKNYVQLSTEWESYSSKPWVLIFCEDEEGLCLSKENRRKLASMLAGIANVGVVACPEHKRDLLCKKLQATGVAFYPAGQIDAEHQHEIDTLHPREIYAAVLDLVPELEPLTDEEYEEVLRAAEETTLVKFRDSKATDSDAAVERELKKLPLAFPDVRMRQVDCSKSSDICSELHLGGEDLPRYVMFKTGGGYEINYNKKRSYHDIATFIRESRSSALVSLTAEQYNEAVSGSNEDLWIVDYFAPWCPPCMKLIPQLRALPTEVLGRRLRTGTIDCVIYKETCVAAGIASYPTAILYANSKQHPSVGYHTTDQVLEAIEDALAPVVRELDQQAFDEVVANREAGTTWVVDFFAPWCGPCKQLAPEYRRVARTFASSNTENLFFGSVDCDAHRGLCTSQGVNQYPTIRLYRAKLSQKTLDYPANWWRDTGSIHRWVTEFLPSLVEIMGPEFYTTVLQSSEPWLVDFYAPWCGHCVQFAPVFEQIAKRLEGRVKLAKVDCDRYPGVCQAAGVRAYPSIKLYIGSPSRQRQDANGIVIQSQNGETVIQYVEHHLAHAKVLRDEL